MYLFYLAMTKIASKNKKNKAVVLSKKKVFEIVSYLKHIPGVLL